MTATVVQVIGLALTIKIMQSGFAACSGLTVPVCDFIAPEIVTFCRITLAILAFARNPSADDVLTHAAVVAAVINVVILTDAFEIMLIGLAIRERFAFPLIELVAFKTLVCMTFAVLAASVYPAGDFLGADIPMLPAIIQIIRLALALIDVLIIIAFD